MHVDPALTAFVTVVFIDLVLAGDNAIVVGMAAAGLPRELRRKAVVLGIAAAAVLRILLAFFAVQLLGIIGLVLAGGLLLLWVAWKLWREARQVAHHRNEVDAGGLPRGIDVARPVPSLAGGGTVAASAHKTFGAALFQIVAADVSMSLDNVLAVAGTARHAEWVLVFGLALSVALMGVAATMIVGLLNRYPWISYIGLGLITWVALTMIWEDSWRLVGAARHAGIV